MYNPADPPSVLTFHRPFGPPMASNPMMLEESCYHDLPTAVLATPDVTGSAR
jgi:hypothetical protein